MKRRPVVILALILASIAAALPYAWRVVRLQRARSAAHRIFNTYTTQERANLNTTPRKIVLPPFMPEFQAVDSVEIGGYIVRFPHTATPAKAISDESRHGSPTPQRFAHPKPVELTYPRFRVIILAPSSIAPSDLRAQQLHFKDAFDLLSATYHARLDALDSQGDLPSLQHYLMLMSEKPARARAPCVEEFDRRDMRGFIFAPLDKETVVEIFLPRQHASCGVWFIDSGGLSPDDVHAFVAAMHFELQDREHAATLPAPR